MAMEEKKEFEVPEVITYDREELDLQVARTQVTRGSGPDD
jgi:hypothetical protein